MAFNLGTTSGWICATASAYLVGAILSGCSSTGASADAGSQQPSSLGQPGPSGGTLLLACNNPYGASQASVSPICTDYYAQAGSEAATLQKTYQAICTGGGGTILSSPCPSTASAGGCKIGPQADDPYAEYTVEIFYSPPATVASVQANCASQNLPYIAPGGGTADGGPVPVEGGGGDGGSTSSGGGASGNTCCQLAANGQCFCDYTDGGPCTAPNMELSVVSSCSPSTCCAVYPQSDAAPPAPGVTACMCVDSYAVSYAGGTCASWLSEVGGTLSSSCP